MGRIFIQHMGGTRLFSCASCETVLTNRDELISTRYIHASKPPHFMLAPVTAIVNLVSKVHWSHRASIPVQQGGQPQVQRGSR